MYKEEERQDIIDRYLQDEMTPEEKKGFEERLEHDPVLKKELLMTRHIKTVFERKGEQEMLKNAGNLSEEELKTMMINIENQHMKTNKRIPLIIMLAAIAAVAFVIVYIGGQPRYGADQLFNEFYTTQPYETVPYRGGTPMDEEKDKLLVEASALYEQGEYAKALEIFDKITADMNLEDTPEEVIFYSAISMLEENKLPEAIERLSYLEAADNSDFQQDAAWSLALAYLKDNQRSEAKTTLEYIVTGNGYYSEEAKDLLKKLDEKKWF
ncbi:MAG: hypothetical protein LUG18_06820 [Candidatus Azobacteroides sp.]|nr:hypothetical protein [Candidatus Azobacteroides sp.]